MENKVRKERLRQGLSQTDLTIRTGIAQSQLSMIERGLVVIHPSWRQRLARALGTTEQRLFGKKVSDGQPRIDHPSARCRGSKKQTSITSSDSAGTQENGNT